VEKKDIEVMSINSIHLNSLKLKFSPSDVNPIHWELFKKAFTESSNHSKSVFGNPDSENVFMESVLAAKKYFSDDREFQYYVLRSLALGNLLQSGQINNLVSSDGDFHELPDGVFKAASSTKLTKKGAFPMALFKRKASEL